MNFIKPFIVFLLAGLFLPANVFAYAPYNELQVNHVNLYHYPKTIETHAPEVEVTIGDLHGNALKLLNFLIRNDVVRISKENYQLIVTIYKKDPHDLTIKDLAFFQNIINTAEINTSHKIRFLGDDLCDRGMNDYYTLAIYKKLDMSSVPFQIVLSNHGNFFLTAYERPEQSFSYNPYGEGKSEDTVQSMLNLGRIIERGLVDKKDILDTVQNHYLKHIVLPGYTLNKEKNAITLYSHAPIDLRMLASLADDLEVRFSDANVRELQQSLMRINRQVRRWIMNNTFSSHYNELNNAHKKSGTPSPLQQVLWNRDYNILQRDEQPKGRTYTVNYVHGHDSMPNVFNLDNLFGKGHDQYKGSYAIYVTHS